MLIHNFIVCECSHITLFLSNISSISAVHCLLISLVLHTVIDLMSNIPFSFDIHKFWQFRSNGKLSSHSPALVHFSFPLHTHSHFIMFWKYRYLCCWKCGRYHWWNISIPAKDHLVYVCSVNEKIYWALQQCKIFSGTECFGASMLRYWWQM